MTMQVVVPERARWVFVGHVRRNGVPVSLLFVDDRLATNAVNSGMLRGRRL